jgi:BASS family bile acid:Na+ symporter
MDAKTLVLAAFQIAIIATVFGYGLQATRDDVIYVVRRPGLMLRSLLAVLVIVPIVVVACIKMLDLPRPTEVVLMALAISPVPPLLPKKQKKAGGLPPYGLGLLLLLGLGSIATVPLSVMVLNHVFDQPLSMRPDRITKIILAMVVAPLVAGLAFSKLLPRISEMLLKPLRLTASALLIAGSLALLAGTWHAIWSATGHWTVISIIAFILLGLLVGHLLGGPEPEHASVLALSCASRHPAIALAVASTNYPGEQFAPTLILYVLLSVAVCVPYVGSQRRRAERISSSS